MNASVTRARLGDPGDAAARQPRVDVADVRRAVRRQVDDAHAVRAEERDPVAAGDLARPRACIRRRRLAALDDAAAGDDHRRHAGRGRVRDDRGRAQRVDRDQDACPGPPAAPRATGSRLAVELVVAAGSRSGSGVALPMTRRLSRTVSAIPPRADAPTTAIERGANSGRRSIGGRRRSALAGAASAVGRPSLTRRPAPTPRFSRARAMISRWISDVPSQIRSTRSSRR